MLDGNGSTLGGSVEEDVVGPGHVELLVPMPHGRQLVPFQKNCAVGSKAQTHVRFNKLGNPNSAI